MEEAEGIALCVRRAAEVGARGLDQPQGAHDVGLDEGLGPGDRAVHMGLGRAVDDRVGLVDPEEGLEGVGLVDAALDELEGGVVREWLEARPYGGKAQAVEHHHARKAPCPRHEGEARADEAGAAGDDPGGLSGRHAALFLVSARTSHGPGRSP